MQMPLLKKLELRYKNLKAQFPKGQASGENITINDSSNLEFDKFNILGNSYQETRESYNLLDFRNARGGTDNLGKNITVTINKDEGTYTINGTVENDTVVNIWLLGGYWNETPLFTLSAGQYYIKDIILFKADHSSYTGLMTLSQDLEVTAVRVPNVVAGQTYTNQVMYPMIAKSDVEVPWIQYGDMPSLDYPSEIKSCGGNINLLDTSSIGTQLVDGVTIKEKDGFITFNGTVKNGSSMITIPVFLEVGTYTFSMSGNHQRPGFTLRTENDIWIQNILGELIKIEQAGTYHISLNLGASGFIYKPEGTAFRLKLEKGTVATSWNPYSNGYGNINLVTSNKNLAYNIQYVSTKSQYGVCISGTYILEKDKFYAVSFNTPNSGARVYLNASDYRGYKKISNIYDFPCDGNRHSYIIQATRTGRTTYAGIINNSTAVESGLLSDFMIEEVDGSNGRTTDYVEHQGQDISIPVQKPFRAVNNYRNCFFFQNNKCYEKHIIRRRILTGNEGWQYYAGQKYFYLIDALPGVIRKDTLSNINFMSNMFLDLNIYDVTDISKYPQYEYSQIAYLKHMSDYRISEIDIHVPECEDDVSAFKAKLQEFYNAGTPLYFDYIADEPELIECNAEQTKILNKLKELHSYKGTTNIFSTDEVSPVFEVEYSKDLESILKEKNSL